MKRRMYLRKRVDFDRLCIGRENGVYTVVGMNDSKLQYFREKYCNFNFLNILTYSDKYGKLLKKSNYKFTKGGD